MRPLLAVVLLFGSLFLTACGGGNDIPTFADVPQPRLDSLEVMTCCPGTSTTPTRNAITVGRNQTVELYAQAIYRGGLIDPEISNKTGFAQFTISNKDVVATWTGTTQCMGSFFDNLCFKLRTLAPGRMNVSATYTDKGVTKTSNTFVLTVQ